MQYRRPLTIITLIGALVIVLIVAWKLVPPLFIDRTVQESFPTSADLSKSGQTIPDTMSEATKLDDQTNIAEDMPIATNNTRAGRAQNRRVEVKLLN